MVADLKYFDGSLAKIDRVPADLRNLYATAFEVDAKWIVEAGARRQKWIDQAQSLNIYMAGASGKKLDETYKLAWLRGLKTTYYLRTLAATPGREVHRRRRRAERRVRARARSCQLGSSAATGASSRDCGAGAEGGRTGAQVLQDRRPVVRSLPVTRQADAAGSAPYSVEGRIPLASGSTCERAVRQSRTDRAAEDRDPANPDRRARDERKRPTGGSPTPTRPAGAIGAGRPPTRRRNATAAMSMRISDSARVCPRRSRRRLRRC